MADGISIIDMSVAFSIYWLFYKEKRLATNRQTHNNFVRPKKKPVKLVLTSTMLSSV